MNKKVFNGFVASPVNRTIAIIIRWTCLCSPPKILLILNNTCAKIDNLMQLYLKLNKCVTFIQKFVEIS